METQPYGGEKIQLGGTFLLLFFFLFKGRHNSLHISHFIPFHFISLKNAVCPITIKHASFTSPWLSAATCFLLLLYRSSALPRLLHLLVPTDG